MISNKLIPMLSADGFYTKTINQSCRFNDDDSAHLTRTPGSAGDRRTFIMFSGWVKRCNLGITCPIVFVDGAINDDILEFNSSDQLTLTLAGTERRKTTQLFRDPTSWFHLYVAIDSTQATAADRITIEVNGVEVTAFGVETDPAQNDQFNFNSAVAHYIGRRSTSYADMYLAEIFMVDGTAPANSIFTQSKYNICIPKAASPTYGTNGAHLGFEAAADLGNDVSGNNNDWTSSGLAAADQVEDSPTDNYPTLNVLHHLSTATLANGNLDCSGTENEYATEQIPSSGKWGWEITVAEDGSFGLEDIDGNEEVAADVNGEVVEMLVDMDAGTLKKKVDGGGLETIEASLNTSSEWYPYFKAACSVDFGQLGYSPTETGYKTLCVSNRDDPAITEPDNGFDVALYEGTGAEQSITDLEFQPDLVWIKNRDAADEHKLVDSVRGVTKELSSNSTAVEGTEANGLTAFISNGFTVGTGANGYNDNGESFAAWCFRMGADYGFDIQTYIGTGVAHAEDHDLGGVPELMIVKELDGAYNWRVYHHHAQNKTDPETDYGELDTTSVWADGNTVWNDAAPTSTQFNLGSGGRVNESGKNYIAYLWRSIAGFSKVFSYTGNGNADGTFVHCGFRPRYILTKRATVGTADWVVLDTKRDTYNASNKRIYPDLNNAETSGTYFWDILSNGFKLRNTYNYGNTNGSLYVGIAIAEQPGKWRNAR